MFSPRFSLVFSSVTVLSLVSIVFFLSSVNACTNRTLRVVGSSSYYGSGHSGRLEICINGYWGTICDDYWTNANAQVACRQLGYSATGATYRGYAYYGEGIGSIWLDNVQCTGSETSLLQCSHNAIGTNDCSHSEDVGISCSTSSSCAYGALRLVGGVTANEGRVEICINNVWGTVCDDFWSTRNAQVACRQLGYSTYGATYHSNAYYGSGAGSILLDNVECTGSENQLTQCRHNAIGNNDCSHSEDVGVYCSPVASQCTYGSLRLNYYGSTSYRYGRLEICLNNVWGTVCDDYWTNDNAGVACRQLGYSATGATYHSNAYFGRGNGSIWLDNVQCTGSESSLLSCTHNSIGSNNCGHSEDVGVYCPNVRSPCTNESLRLVGGVTSTEGRVEICINGEWGTVCDDYFGHRDAQVVCRQLGYPTSGAVAHGDAYYGSGYGTSIWLDNVMCTGSESRLVDCRHNRIGTNDCSHSEDVGVSCLAVHPGIIAALVICGILLMLCLLAICTGVLVGICYRRRKRAHLYSVLRSPSVTVASPPDYEEIPSHVPRQYPPPPPYTELKPVADDSNFQVQLGGDGSNAANSTNIPVQIN